MFAALPKSKEYGDKLVDILTSGQKLEEWEMHSWIRDIKKLNDRKEESYLLALAYAAGGKKEKAVVHFEESLYNDDDGVNASNYIIYIGTEGTVEEYLKVSSKLADMYVSREMYAFAFYMHLHCGKLEDAWEYAKNYIKVSPNGEDKIMQNQLAYLESNYKKFMEVSKIGKAQFDILATSMAQVMRKHKASSARHHFHNITEESVNAYVITIPNADLDKVSQMNYDLAFELADHDELLGVHVSAWFEVGPSSQMDEASLTYMDKK